MDPDQLASKKPAGLILFSQPDISGLSLIRVKLDPFFQKGNQRDDDRTDGVGVADAKSLLQHSHNIFF